MKASDLIAIALRLMALYLFFTALSTIVQQLQISSMALGNGFGSAYIAAVIVGLVHIAIPLLGGLALFRFPQTIARWLLPSDSDLPMAIGMTANELQSAAFCIFGVYLVAVGIPDVIGYVVWTIYLLRDGTDSPFDLPDILLNGLQALIELGIGLALCLRPEALHRLIARLRTTGVAQA